MIIKASCISDTFHNGVLWLCAVMRHFFSGQHSKSETLARCRFDAGPPSLLLAQHETHIGSISRFCWCRAWHKIQCRIVDKRFQTTNRDAPLDIWEGGTSFCWLHSFHLLKKTFFFGDEHLFRWRTKISDFYRPQFQQFFLLTFVATNFSHISSCPPPPPLTPDI